MIISPPFLPARLAGQSEAAWLDSAMPSPASRLPGTLAPEGSFPLSHDLCWHTGLHIQAPTDANGTALSVRSIADGTVVFVSPPTASNADPTHGQNYNPFARLDPLKPAWTDNGCLIIEHRTTIGADGTNETEVVFFSLYMHLSSIGRSSKSTPGTSRPWQAGDAVHRKDEIGRPGRIYGSQGQIHFEICMDEVHLQRLVGRPLHWLNPTHLRAPVADGRNDSIYGDIYFYLPATTPIHAGPQPAANLRQECVTTLGTPIWVRMTYRDASCQFESFDESGSLIGRVSPGLGEYYNLSAEAMRRHTALPLSDQQRSSPSGWYELLRFGRNIGRGAAPSEKDLLPFDAAHWRRIAGPDGAPIWADLNTEGSHKFSDADFLPAMGWNFIGDDSTPSDQRCDSVHTKTVIGDSDSLNTQRMGRAQLAQRLGTPGVQDKLRRMIVRLPSEWDKNTISTRYCFLKEPPYSMDKDNWSRFENHLKAICPAGLPEVYIAASWYISPKEFVRQLQKCNWLSKDELLRIYPDSRYPLSALAAEGKGRTPSSIREKYRAHLNRITRKYLVTDATRLSHFLGQGAVESMNLALMMEGSADFSRSSQHASFRDETNGFYEPRSGDYLFYLENRLGNVDTGDGPKFRGRGLKQITGRENYSKYWVYRGWLSKHTFSPKWWDPPRPRLAPQIEDPQKISLDPFNSIDAGGWFWDCGAASNRFRSINTIITTDLINRDTVRTVARAINGINRQTGEPNGLDARLAETEHIAKILLNATP